MKGSIKVSIEDYANQPEVKIENGIKDILKQMEVSKEELFFEAKSEYTNNLVPPANSDLLVDQFGYKSSEIFAPEPAAENFSSNIEVQANLKLSD